MDSHHKLLSCFSELPSRYQSAFLGNTVPEQRSGFERKGTPSVWKRCFARLKPTRVKRDGWRLTNLEIASLSMCRLDYGILPFGIFFGRGIFGLIVAEISVLELRFFGSVEFSFYETVLNVLRSDALFFDN